MTKRMLRGFFGFLVVFCAGCDLIKEARFHVDENFDRVGVSLVFTDKVKLKYEKSLAIKEYGFVEIKKFTDTQPFQMNVDLKTAVVSDDEIAELSRVYLLPNGVSTDVPQPLAEVREALENTDPMFSLFGYVDTVHHTWVGMAVLFGFYDNDDIPRDFESTQIFARDRDGRPALFAKVFGPTIDDKGKLKRAAGAAVFANFRALVSQRLVVSGRSSVFNAEDGWFDTNSSSEM